MTDSSVDLSSLSPDQQSALQQYTSVTAQDIEAAVSLLRRCEWNVQIAITRFFDGDTDIVDVAAEAARQPPPAERRVENIQDSFDVQAFSGRRRGLEPAPRVVPTPESQMTQRLPLLVSIIFLPFNVTYSIFSRIFSTIGWAFPFLPRLLSRLYPAQTASSSRYAGRKPLNPRDTAARFIREFEEDYGAAPGTLPFQESGYAQAFDIAKRDLKYLLVVLLSPEHDDTGPFVRDTLLSQDFQDFLKTRSDLLIWGGSVQDSEAYQVSNALNVTKFPFVGLIVHTPSVSSTAMSIVARLPGPISAPSLIEQLQKAITTRDEELRTARATRAERLATASIREEQNSAYERSLATDRARAQQRREAEAAREQEEREARERAEAKASRAQNIAAWRTWRAQSIESEPAAEVKDVVRISLRLPSGERVVRRFASAAQMEELYAYVECYDVLQQEDNEKLGAAAKPKGFEHEYGFRLVSPMPREVFGLEQGGTIAGRIGRSGNLIVERVEPEEEDGDEGEDD
ncbi:hypothetical protein K461DRAFT_323147 [Myriangium duriaei CBS 260.36]|uniref:UBX domain-containing protein n=1 Tax=Myriangium duriaei CBS 260.36 TaxID=1168546 RepID=A0A9P4IVL7_9PEZI|nr:hypothetical protein K461DRAFT_323147 [Myriangium duriaei CBS 260.36]